MQGASSASARPSSDWPRRDAPIDLAELTLTELEALFDQRHLPRFHARQIFRWIWKRGVTDFSAMTDLGLALREQLAEDFRISTPAIVRRDVSEDGTQKFVLALQDARRIESVFIPDTPAQTFCISTQVGCAMGCAFCLTGKMGLVRNLTAGEIAGQVRVLSHALQLPEFNIVLMGMGEPLHNYDATLKALTAYTGGVHLILGGYDKGAEFAELAAATEGRVKQVLLIGATAPRLATAFAARAATAGPLATPYVLCGDLQGAVTAAAASAEPGDVVLLSPACASWDQYRDYEQRGEQFLRLVSELRARS